jgi:hypothetical protein
MGEGILEPHESVWQNSNRARVHGQMDTLLKNSSLVVLPHACITGMQAPGSLLSLSTLSPPYFSEAGRVMLL